MSMSDDALASIDEKEVARLTAEMVDIPSHVGAEKALADYLADRFRRHGLQTSLQEVEPGRFNVYGVLEGSGGGPTLLYGSHLDTGYAGDEEGIRELGEGHRPKARIDEDWIYGLGAGNMKGGIAATVVAVEALVKAKARLRGDVVLAGFVGETLHVPVAHYQGSRYHGTGIGAEFAAAKGIRADMAVFPVTTATKISLASGGLVYLEFTTHGDPGSTFRRGSVTTPLASRDDAVSRMLGFVPALKQWGESYAATRHFHGKPSGHANVIAIEGGHPFRPSKLPSFCRLYFEVGMMAGDDPEPIVAAAADLAGDYSRAHRIEIGMRVVKIAHGAEIAADAPLVTALSDAHEAIWGKPPELTWDGWCTDSAVLMRAGIPALSYGASGRRRNGQPGYPREGEQVNVGDLTRTAEVFARLACDVGMADRGAFAKNKGG